MPFLQYLSTALWSSIDNDTPLDTLYDNSDISAETLTYLKTVFSRFFSDNEELITCALEFNDEYQIARDLWLTQNGHGAGFWDGDYPEKLGEKLTEAAKKAGEINLYVGDDNKIYHM